MRLKALGYVYQVANDELPVRTADEWDVVFLGAILEEVGWGCVDDAVELAPWHLEG